MSGNGNPAVNAMLFLDLSLKKGVKDSKKFFLARPPRDVVFTWNDARAQDWRIIKRFFISAYVNAYAYIYKDSPVGEDPLGVADECKAKARGRIERILDQQGRMEVDLLIDQLLRPLQAFYKMDFESEKHVLLSHLQNKETVQGAGLHVINYLQFLYALIYYFQDAFNAEKLAIEQVHQLSAFPVQYVVARLHDQPIGFISCVENYKSAKVYLRWVNMSPSFQGDGLGRRMLEEVSKRYSGRGLELYTRKLNLGASHFYPSCGLAPVERIFGKQEDQSLSKVATVWWSNHGLFPPDDDLIAHHHETYIGFQGKLTSRRDADVGEAFHLC